MMPWPVAKHFCCFSMAERGNLDVSGCVFVCVSCPVLPGMRGKTTCDLVVLFTIYAVSGVTLHDAPSKRLPFCPMSTVSEW